MRLVSNPPNPWLKHSVEWLGEPPEATAEVFEETATRSIISRNESPDVGFQYSVNPYRGCPHACTYCFARPYHEYLGWGAGTDFERKIVAKVRAPELLRRELMRPKWKGDELVFSFASDPYLPHEANYKLTRQCLEVCLDFRNPVGVITKSALVRRDADVLAQLADKAAAEVFLTIPFADYDTARAVEPFAPSPDARFRAMKELSDAGIPVGLAVAPVIPGLTEDIPELLQRAHAAGARRAFMTMLRLPGSVAEYFELRLRERLPTKADKVLHRIREARGGRLNDARFGHRMRGAGAHWQALSDLFQLWTKRLGFNQTDESVRRAQPGRNTFRRPSAQGRLWES
jgi:DNA repair photolyase